MGYVTDLTDEQWELIGDYFRAIAKCGVWDKKL